MRQQPSLILLGRAARACGRILFLLALLPLLCIAAIAGGALSALGYRARF